MSNDECTFEMKSYKRDSQVCDEKLCYVCKEGMWQEEGALDFLIGGP